MSKIDDLAKACEIENVHLRKANVLRLAGEMAGESEAQRINGKLLEIAASVLAGTSLEAWEKHGREGCAEHAIKSAVVLAEKFNEKLEEHARASANVTKGEDDDT